MTDHIADYIGLTENAEKTLIEALSNVSKQHAFETDVAEMCAKFKLWSEQHLDSVEKLSAQFGKKDEHTSEELSAALLSKSNLGSFGLLRDLHALSILVHHVHICWTVMLQASKALRNSEMETACTDCESHFKKEAMWLQTRIKSAAPQVLIVA
jgi:hypothetical protein